MADNNDGISVMGVLVGALIVIVVGEGLLFATGTLGSKSSTVKELPKTTIATIERTSRLVGKGHNYCEWAHVSYVRTAVANDNSILTFQLGRY